jgi:DNA-binding winged helix-turn-helix (wHTH) protein/dipeptidyl aminopeptidase/acylaminoacyl peptidase
MAQPVVWVVGDWHYWPDSGRLKNGDAEQRLSRQQNQVFALLVDRAPDMVERETFMAHVWTGKIVNEDALSRTIAELRKTLGDSAARAQYIKTIPKKGYRLNLQPEPLAKRRQRHGILSALVILLLFVSGWTWWLMNHEPLGEQLIRALANASRLTADPGMEQHSQLSADGSQLSFVRHGPDSQLVIRSVADANQQHVVELPRHRLAAPVLFSDDQRVFFTATDRQQCYLMSVDLVTRHHEEWGGCVYNSESRLLSGHDEAGLLIYSDRTADDQVAIFQLHPLSGERRQLTMPDNSSLQDWSGRLSPDQRWLSFTRGNQSVRNLWLKNLASGAEQPLTRGEHYSVSHHWLDDEHIIYDSDVNGSRQLWLINIHDQQTQPLGGYGAQHPSTDRSGGLLSFQIVSYEANIWQQDLASGAFTRLVHSNKYDNYPAFAPDGQSFVYSSNRQDLGSIWLSDARSGEDRLLLSIDGAKLSRPAWTNDGSGVLITVNDDNGYWTLLYDLASGEQQALPFSNSHHSAMQHQGAWYALAKSATLEQRILVWHAGEERLLPITAVSRFRILANGQLVYSRADQQGLFVYDPQTGTESLLLADFPANALNLWTTANLAVYHDQGGDEPGTWRLDTTTGEHTRISNHRAYSVGTSMAVDPQEQRLLLVRNDRAESDVFLATLEDDQ